jgi:hypothetical protein
MADVAALLERWQQAGDKSALDEMLPAVYDELLYGRGRLRFMFVRSQDQEGNGEFPLPAEPIRFGPGTAVSVLSGSALQESHGRKL